MPSRISKLEKGFKKIRTDTIKICERLAIEDQVVQPNAEVSPPKWHMGHTTWFLEELILMKFSDNYQFYKPITNIVFNSYYKSLGQHWPQSERGQLSRPTVKEILSYRRAIDELMDELIQTQSSNEEFLDLLELAINHEEQHLELLLMDIKCILGKNPELPAYISQSAESKKQLSNPKTLLNEEWKIFQQGIYEIGSSSLENFHYDNEGPRHKVYLESFLINERMVTNGEYKNFIQDGSYKQPLLWKSLGFDWVNREKINRPLYWNENLEEEYTLYGSIPIDLNAPVSHISFFEADAYARWMNQRLPTEVEFEVASKLHPLRNKFMHFHPEENGTFSSELWCWCSSQYTPYPGYRPYEGAVVEYNGKFMCNQFILRGGSFATPNGHYRKSYRNFYEPQQRWMFSGFCLAKDNL